MEFLGRSRSVPYHLYGEDRHRITLDNVPVVGSYRRAILRKLSYNTFSAWAGRSRGRVLARAVTPPLDEPYHRMTAECLAAEMRLAPTDLVRAHSSRLAAACGDRLMSLSYTVRKCHDRFLLRFFILAAAEWLPVERRLHVADRMGDAGRGDLCKLCGCRTET